MLLTRTKCGLALVLACALGAGFVAHQALTAQTVAPDNARYADERKLPDAWQPPGIDAGSPATAPEIDRRLADLERRLEGALGEVKAIRGALKTAGAGATPIRLKSARAARAAEVLRAAFPEGRVRITRDDQTNTIFVQAAAADLRAVRRLLEALDGEHEGAADKQPSQQRPEYLKK